MAHVRDRCAGRALRAYAAVVVCVLVACCATAADGQKKERVDCPGLGALAWAARPLFRADSLERVNTTFFLRTRRRREATDVRTLGSDVLNVDRPTIIIVHGFLSSASADWVQDMAHAFLDQMDADVVAVDWSGGASSWRYWKAVANARVACAVVTGMLQNVRGLDRRRVHCVGHSLGAHVCSFVAKQLGGIGRVTGLDPAAPCFEPDDRNMRLTRSDAHFVDVVHTNGRPLLRLGLGLPDPVGHVDFYPNGGMLQPGCEERSAFVPSSVLKTICSHGRAHVLFIESLRSRNCSFWGHLWDRRPESVNETMKTSCDLQRCSEMGLRTAQYPARGSFYVQTEDEAPFCERQPALDAQMARLLAASNAVEPS